MTEPRNGEDKITEILVGLTRLEAKADATNQHLSQLNGSVKTLFNKSEENRRLIEGTTQGLLQHQIDCPGLKLIAEVDRKLFTGQFKGSNEDFAKEQAFEARQELKDWKKEWLYPAIKIGLGMIGTLILYHAGILLKVIK